MTIWQVLNSTSVNFCNFWFHQVSVLFQLEPKLKVQLLWIRMLEKTSWCQFHLQWRLEIIIQNAIIWWSPYLLLMTIHRMLWSKTWETSTNCLFNVGTWLSKLQAQRKMSASSLQQVRCWILGIQFNTDDVVNCSSTPLKYGILVLKQFQPFKITTHVSWVWLHLQSFYLVMQMLWF